MSRFPKITETFILYEMIEHESQGIAIELYPLLRERQPVSHPEVEKFIHRAHFLPFISWPILRANFHYMMRRPRAYFRMLAEVLGGTFGSANFLFGALGVLPKSVRFAYEMERSGVNHVHAHFATHPAVAALIIHRLAGIPYSFTAHGSDVHVERRMLEQKIRAAAFVVSISSYNKNLMIEECHSPVRDKIHVIHCGVDPDFFSPREKRLESRPVQILCVASFEAVKGHEYLVSACRLLKKQGVYFKCHFVGDGPIRDQVEAQIREAGLNDRIIIHGPLPRTEVIKLLEACDIFALPSVLTKNGKREGIPVVIMEAMACGVPVVSSQLSGIPELVDHDVSGILVTPRDIQGLANALQRLSADEGLRERMGVAGREKVLREFNLRSNAAQLGKLFWEAGAGRAMLKSCN
jgi:glycosyltransferase involved in cell wall biosynthesis